jgi:hypothetical protein
MAYFSPYSLKKIQHHHHHRRHGKSMPAPRGKHQSSPRKNTSTAVLAKQCTTSNMINFSTLKYIE